MGLNLSPPQDNFQTSPRPSHFMERVQPQNPYSPGNIFWVHANIVWQKATKFGSHITPSLITLTLFIGWQKGHSGLLRNLALERSKGFWKTYKGPYLTRSNIWEMCWLYRRQGKYPSWENKNFL